MIPVAAFNKKNENARYHKSFPTMNKIKFQALSQVNLRSYWSSFSENVVEFFFPLHKTRFRKEVESYEIWKL